jgi:ribosomal protein S18 acetylase RimI-like enzyme
MTTLQPTRPAGRAAVRKAGTDDASAVASALAAAFADDSVFRWILPDDRLRAAVVPPFFDLVVEILAPHDEIWTTTAGVTGAATWVPFGKEAMPEERAEAFAAELAELSGPYADRMLQIIGLLDEHHPAQPHEYLWFLGVVPAAQGRGIGSALMAPVLERADRAGAPCYLEATTPRNKALYERHGFTARDPIGVAGSPPLWPMWREAVAGRAAGSG